MITGQGPLAVFIKAGAAGGSGPPFTAGSANNGLSVDAVTGKIVMGNDVAGATAVLLSNREIPSAGFFIALSGTGNLIIGKNTDAGQRLQIDQALTGAQVIGAVGITASWNTTGIATLISAVVTNTASGLGSLLMDVRTTAGVRFRNFSDGHVQWGDPVAVQAMTWSPISIAAGGNSGAGGQSTSFQILARYGQASGTTQLNSISINDFMSPTGGTSTSAAINIQQTFNQGAGYTGIARGVYYNPQIIALHATSHIAWENVLGDVNIGTTSGGLNIGVTGALTGFFNNATHFLSLGDVNSVANKTLFQLDDGGAMGATLVSVNGLSIQGVTGFAHGRLQYDPASSIFTIANSAVGSVQIGNATEGDIFSIAALGVVALNGGGGNQYFSGDGTTAAILVQLGDLQARNHSTTLKIVDASSQVQIAAASGLKVTGDATNLVHTGQSMTNFAAAALGTLTNAPVAGNPTKWIQIDDNGTARRIPCW